MARVYGPLLSSRATGPLAGVLSYGNTHGRSWVRRSIAATDPESPPQIATRAMFRFLSTAWPPLSPIDKASWSQFADAASLDLAMSYRAYNLERWGQFRGPTKSWPPALTGYSTGVRTFTATGGVAHVHYVWTNTQAVNLWGLTLHRSLVHNFVPTRSNCIAVLLSDTTGSHSYDDSGLAPGLYHYVAKLFSATGLLGAANIERDATVT